MSHVCHTYVTRMSHVWAVDLGRNTYVHTSIHIHMNTCTYSLSLSVTLSLTHKTHKTHTHTLLTHITHTHYTHTTHTHTHARKTCSGDSFGKATSSPYTYRENTFYTGASGSFGKATSSPFSPRCLRRDFFTSPSFITSNSACFLIRSSS